MYSSSCSLHSMGISKTEIWPSFLGPHFGRGDDSLHTYDCSRILLLYNTAFRLKVLRQPEMESFSIHHQNVRCLENILREDVKKSMRKYAVK